MDSFAPTWVAAADVTALAGVTAMPDTTLVKTAGLKEKREYDKSIPYGMQLASELQLTLSYAELTAAQQEILLKPAVNIGSNEGIDYVLTNVWTLKTDRGSSGVTWYVESQFAQRRTPEQEFTYSEYGVVDPTEITITLHDIRRVILERVELPTTGLTETDYGRYYKGFYIGSDDLRTPYVEHVQDAGKGLTMKTATIDDLCTVLSGKWQQLYRYMVRDAAAVVDFYQPYNVGVRLYEQSLQYHADRSATFVPDTSLLFVSSISKDSDRLAGMLSDDEESLRSDSAYSWDFLKSYCEWAVVKECWYVTETAGTYTLNLRYYALLDRTLNAGVRQLTTADIVGTSWKMKRGGATIRKVEYVNKGSIDDDREAFVVENKGSISENGWSIQGLFSAERDMYELYRIANANTLYDNAKNIYFVPAQLVTTGVNIRKLLYYEAQVSSNGFFSSLIAVHPTPDITVGFGSVTVGSAGSGYPEAIAPITATEGAAGSFTEEQVVTALLAMQDASSYGMAVARVILFLFGNEDNRLYTMTVHFDASGSSTLLPHNVGDAYQIPASWIASFGGDDRAILTKADIDWLARTMACEFLNVYDNDITGA